MFGFHNQINDEGTKARQIMLIRTRKVNNIICYKKIFFSDVNINKE